MNYINKIIDLFDKKEQPKQQEEMIIDINIKLPVNTVKKEKKKKKVTVFTNFVKVGYNQYRIKVDPFTGYEYVLIKGKRYDIFRDIWTGRGVLVEL